jgi:hypothetical protein
MIFRLFQCTVVHQMPFLGSESQEFRCHWRICEQGWEISVTGQFAKRHEGLLYFITERLYFLDLVVGYLKTLFQLQSF